MEQSTTTIVLLALITGMPAILLALARLIDTLRNRRKLDELAREINGRLDQLLEEREARARLEGYQAGRGITRKPPKPGTSPEQDSSLPPG